MSLLRTICTMILLTLAVPSVWGQDCLSDLFPIKEVDLLDPEDRWPEMMELEDSVRTVVLTSLGFVDTTGAPYDRVDGYEVFRCTGEEGVEFVAYYLNGNVDEHDDYVYLVTQREDRWVDKMLVAQLQTTCSSTYLRACRVTEGPVLRVDQLEHRFDCETQEFVDTGVLPAFLMEIRTDGTFNEVEIEEE